MAGVLVSGAGGAAARAECLESPKAVWSVHPGSHALWHRRHDSEKCWYARGHRATVEAYAVRSTPRDVDLLSGFPLPLPRPAATDTEGRADGAPPPPGMGGARSILMWGKPMEIDATWDDMFVSRELHHR